MHTLGDHCPQDFLTDGVEDLSFIVAAEELVDGREGGDDGLLEDPETDSHVLEILGSGGDGDVDGLELDVVDDGFLGDERSTWMRGMRKL